MTEPGVDPGFLISGGMDLEKCFWGNTKKIPKNLSFPSAPPLHPPCGL